MPKQSTRKVPQFYVEIYKSPNEAGGPWRWRIRARNNRIIAHGEGYVSRSVMMNSIERLFEFFNWSDLDVVDLTATKVESAVHTLRNINGK